MFKRCPCTLRVTKKSCWLFIVFALTLVCPQVQAQSPASVITLPHKPMTYEDALQIIGKELGVHVGHVPDIAELKDSCTVYGKMTFGKFFEPLKARGLLYHFMTDNFNFFQDNGFQMSRFGSGKMGWPAVLENSGCELSLTATVADKNYFGWDLAVNWTIPKNKLVSFPQLGSSDYAGRLVVGQSINVLRGYVYKGVDRQSGLYSFADLDGDGRITQADQRVVGKFDVTGFGGLENTIRWRQFQFQLLIDVRLATGLNYLVPIFANDAPGMINNGLSSNIPRVLLDHWRKQGDRAAYQKLYAAPDVNADSTMQLYLSSSALLANTSFLRLRKLSIVYDLPPARVAAMHLSSLELFADAQNLFVVSPYKADPEIQSVLTTPTMRTIELGVRISH